jgi:hypothetical protein
MPMHDVSVVGDALVFGYFVVVTSTDSLVLLNVSGYRVCFSLHNSRQEKHLQNDIEHEVTQNLEQCSNSKTP